MSTYWYFECLDHIPALQSAEFTQHTDDGAYRAGVELAQQRPVVADGCSTGTGHFEGNARSFLVQHPSCRLDVVSEYGERRALPDSQTPSIAGMAPGTTFRGRTLDGVLSSVDLLWFVDAAGNVFSIGAHHIDGQRIDPSTIRDVTPPTVTS